MLGDGGGTNGTPFVDGGGASATPGGGDVRDPLGDSDGIGDGGGWKGTGGGPRGGFDADTSAVVMMGVSTLSTVSPMASSNAVMLLLKLFNVCNRFVVLSLTIVAMTRTLAARIFKIALVATLKLADRFSINEISSNDSTVPGTTRLNCTAGRASIRVMSGGGGENDGVEGEEDVSVRAPVVATIAASAPVPNAMRRIVLGLGSSGRNFLSTIICGSCFFTCFFIVFKTSPLAPAVFDLPPEPALLAATVLDFTADALPDAATVLDFTADPLPDAATVLDFTADVELLGADTPLDGAADTPNVAAMASVAAETLDATAASDAAADDLVMRISFVATGIGFGYCLVSPSLTSTFISAMTYAMTYAFLSRVLLGFPDLFMIPGTTDNLLSLY